MKSKFLLSLATAMLSVMSAFAQVPNEMSYQVMVIHGLAAPQDVKIDIELRKSKDGSAIWKKAFELKEVKNKSVQNLTLDFDGSIDFLDGPYWIATFIDGEEMGCAKMNSVPYAFCAKKAETLSSYITREEMIGEWISTDEYVRKEYNDHLHFYEDGTLKYYKYGRLHNTGTWKLFGNFLTVQLIYNDDKGGREDGANILIYDREENILYYLDVRNMKSSFHVSSTLTKVK